MLQAKVFKNVGDSPSENITELDLQKSKKNGIITFEDYFYQPSVQRKFLLNVLSLQVLVNLPSTLASFFCTFLSNQIWFWEGGIFGNDLLNSLLLHSVILSTVMLLYPLFTYKWKYLSSYSGAFSKMMLDATIRIYQAALLTFWGSYILQNAFKNLNQEYFTSLEKLPFMFLVSLYYGLSLTIHLVICGLLRFSQMRVSVCNFFGISFGISGIIVLISMSFMVSPIASGYVKWDLGQSLSAGVVSAIDGSLILWSLRHMLKNNSPENSGIHGSMV